MGHLSHEDIETGVPFGVLRDIHTFIRDFQTPHVVFCFDYGKPIRSDALPGYKANRSQENDPNKQEQRRRVRRQMELLRTDYLPSIGFCNLCYEFGYEADDMIASAVAAVRRRKERAVIVSSDHDLYQLLSPDVILWKASSQENYTHCAFQTEFGIEPEQWVDVKAIAGCKSDNVPGIPGVGEITAAKFLAGLLKPTSQAYKKIVAGNATWQLNREIVRLPYSGTPEVSLYQDETTKERWAGVLARLGIRSVML